MIGVQIPGYTFGTSKVAKSPITDQEFDLLKQTVTTRSLLIAHDRGSPIR